MIKTDAKKLVCPLFITQFSSKCKEPKWHSNNKLSYGIVRWHLTKVSVAQAQNISSATRMLYQPLNTIPNRDHLINIGTSCNKDGYTILL